MSEAKRNPTTYLYQSLNWDFIRLMADIAFYAEGKYGKAENYADSELTGNKSPLNHIPEHYRQYRAGESHDHFPGGEYHLAAIAYNAMMEYLYFKRRGHVKSELAELKFPERLEP